MNQKEAMRLKISKNIPEIPTRPNSSGVWPSQVRLEIVLNNFRKNIFLHN